MSSLAALRQRLNKLRLRRRNARWAVGYSALALAMLWTLAGAFLADWALQLSRPQRVVSLVACAAIVLWAARRFTFSWLRTRESEIDIALLVERHEKIDSDLVAAIQFESADAPRWGSTELEQAVIDYVAEFGKGWRELPGSVPRQLGRRATALAATLACLGIALAMYPGYGRAFFNRFFLGAAHYPTRTVIERVLVNARPVEHVSAGGQLARVKSPYGKPLRIEVRCGGELPEQGRAELQSSAGGPRAALTLERRAGADPAKAVYVGELPRLVDSLEYELFLGDAWTDPAAIEAIAPPVVEVRLLPAPPPYARSAETPEAPPARRDISVIEGSEVGVQVTCGNKRLSSATLAIEGRQFPLTELPEAKSASDGPQAQRGRHWKLHTAATPLARVERPLRFEIQVTDEDGLGLEQPVSGSIHIKPDQPPRVLADMVTRAVLPTATPEVAFRAADDFGIARLFVRAEVRRPDGSQRYEPPVAIGKPATPILRDRLPLDSTYRLDLSQFNLAKGDQLTITVEAIDFRGDRPGQSATSEPIVLTVTDESGVLAAISQSDERSARQLDVIIQRQLGIGESK